MKMKHSRTAELVAGGHDRDGLSLLRTVLKSPDLRRVFPGIALAALLSNLLAVALPMAILQIMDRVVVNQSIETLAFLVIGIIVALIIEAILRSINGLVTGWLGARFEHSSSVAALERMMRVPIKRYQREEPGVYAERILASTQVSSFYSGSALLVLLDLPFAVIFLAIIYVIAGWVVLVPITLLTIFSYIIVRFGEWMRELIEKRHVVDNRRYSFIAEVLENILSVKTSTMEGLMLRRYERLQESNAEMGETLTRSTALASGLGSLFSQIMVLCVVFAGAVVVIRGDMTSGGLAACMMLSVRALQPLRGVLAFWLRYQSFAAAHQRLAEVMAMPCTDEAGKPEMPPLQVALELKDVTLSHGGGNTLFSGLSLKVPAGNCIVVRGDSGSGKSSLMALMCGLIEPDSGAALVDGRPLTDFVAASVHHQIALLPQSSAVVAGTILENMTMFDDGLNARALSIAREMGLDRVVAAMKLGYETPLGEGAATSIPEGVRQLITIVRALVRDPSVILFDEANIALDIEGDTMLRDYLAAQKGRVTMVLVTHRPSLANLADKVYVLSDKRLIEASELAADAGQTQKKAEVVEVTERPAAMADLAAIIQRQFAEPSDLSACLGPLLEAMAWQGSQRELAEALPHLVPRLDLSNFCSIMANLDLLPKHFNDSLATLDARLLPCLFVLPDEPAVVVKAALPGGGWRVFDSRTGKDRDLMPDDAIGEVYVFRKSEAPAVPQRLEGSWFGRLAWRLRRHILLAFILTLVGALLSLAPPLFVMAIYDRVLPTGDLTMGAYILLGAAIAVALDWVVRNLRGRVMAYIGGRTEYILGSSVFERVLNLPATSTEGVSVGRQVGRIKNLEGLRDFFIGPLAMLAFELPASLLMLFVVVFINAWIVAVVFFSALGFTLIGFATRRIGNNSSDHASRNSALRWELLNETLVNMRAIRTVGAEAKWLQRFRDVSGKSVMAGFGDRQSQARIGGAAQVLGTCTGLIALALSAMLAIEGSLTGGAMMATMMLVWRLTGPMQNIFLATTSITQVGNQMRQVENLMRLQTEREGGTRQTIRPAIHGALSFARVSFRYANDADPALLGVSFSVSPGELVVITGPNAAGKSSLLKLVVRAYVPQAGTIRLDSIDIRQLTASDLRARISYMLQQCELYYGTVAQNLRMAHPAATDEELRWAASMAGVLGDIEAMPEGFATRISNSRSDQLPHGFRQRLSLARTMLKPAAVVLLDEPGAGMDQDGEDALLRCIEWLRGRSTVLMVSQRPGHMRLADHVLYMEKGSVIAMGRFDEIKDKIMSGMRK